MFSNQQQRIRQLRFVINHCFLFLFNNALLGLSIGRANQYDEYVIQLKILIDRPDWQKALLDYTHHHVIFQSVGLSDD